MSGRWPARSGAIQRAWSTRSSTIVPRASVDETVAVTQTARRIALALVGVAVFLARSSYQGPLAQAVGSWGGNVAVSFAVYFIAAIAASRHGLGRLAAGAAALLAVEAFEVTNGFGVMANTFDPVDLLANAAGVAAALAVDLAITRRASEPSR